MESEIDVLRHKQENTPDSATDTIHRPKYLSEYTKEEREQYDKELSDKGQIENVVF